MSTPMHTPPSTHANTPTDTLEALLGQLRRRDIRIRLDGDRVRISAPPGALTDELRAAMKARRDEIVAFLRQAGRAREAAADRITPAPRAGAMPLSLDQQRLWVIEQLGDTHGAYHMPAALALQGPLDVTALERSLAAMVQRHEVLRTCFPRQGERPVQQILPPAPLPLPVVDATADEVERRAAAEARRPFDLTREPPLRASLLRLGPDDHVLLLTLHHIAGDAQSIGVLVRELGAHYRAHCRAPGAAGEPGAAADLPALPVQYADYAHWQNQRLQRGALDADLAYWQERLAGAPALLGLPTDHVRPRVQGFAGAAVRFTVPAPLVHRLRTLARAADATLFMTLLAAYGALLARHSGQDDVVIGSPVANRDHQTEHLAGLFVNMLPLRLALPMDQGFRALLDTVREHALAGYAHREVPLAQLVERLRPGRDASYSPLFQVTFDLQQDAPVQALELPGLRLRMLDVDSRSTQFDLVLSLVPEGEALRGTFTYQRDLFAAATVEGLAARFTRLLEAVVAAPARPLGELALIDEGERARLLDTWARGPARALPEAPVHRRIEDQARRMPDHVAVEHEGERLTYGALNRRANQLAHHLRALGVGPGVRAGASLGRGPDMIVALLAIFKAGGAYVPLTPELPRERLAFFLQDTGAAVVVTSGSLPHAPDHAALAAHGAQVVDLERDAGALAARPAGDPAWDVALSDAAYVIYTSGSTGTPKGVVTEHGALANLCRDMCEHWALGSRDRFLQFFSFQFDGSLQEIVPSLAAGATLVLRGAQVWTPAEALRRIAALGVTVMEMTPAYWHRLVQGWAGHEEAPARLALRLVILGGEEVTPAMLAAWKRLGLTQVRLMNAYGPTEASVCATMCDLGPVLAAPAPPARVPIGRPLSNRHIYVLDPHGQPVPPGVPGEMHIGGYGLAREYLGQSALTAERFVPDPFAGSLAGVEGARMYRTGDQARWTHDGALEYLGRNDSQVKIRGFRVELGEIEARLAEHPAVQAAAVRLWSTATADGVEDRQIVAYVVPRAPETTPEAAIDIAGLRRHLRASLPDYALPAAHVVLAALPLTPTGKLDRHALPPPDPDAHAATRQPPRSPLEMELAAIWQEVLGGVPGGMHAGVLDSFFDLGGHSLSALQVLARIQERYGVELPLRGFFERSTIADVAAAIEHRRAAAAEPAAAEPAGAEPASPAAAPPRLVRRSRDDRRVRAAARSRELPDDSHD